MNDLREKLTDWMKLRVLCRDALNSSPEDKKQRVQRLNDEVKQYYLKYGDKFNYEVQPKEE